MTNIVALKNTSRDRVIDMQHEDKAFKQLREIARESTDVVS